MNSMRSSGKSSSKYKFIFSNDAKKSLEKLDQPVRLRLGRKLKEILTKDDPLQYFEPLSGNLKDYHKLRIGQYRLIVFITENQAFQVLHVGHRREVYLRR